MIRNINRHVIPECYLDTSLVETIVPPDEIGRIRVYNHQFGFPSVVKEMKEEFADNFAVGIVDQDKVPVKYLFEFKEPLVIKLGLQLFKHPHKNHYFIVHPPLERWLIDEARQVGIALDDAAYNLPTTLNELTKASKQEFSKKDPRFKRLFRDLKKANAAGIMLLSHWLAHLKANPYNANINTLRNL
jgi:hypothetical protein